MSNIVKRVCDKCNKEITGSLDVGHIYLSYNNSIGYDRSFELDVCPECHSKVIAALKVALKDVFNNPEKEIQELDTFFSMESDTIKGVEELVENSIVTTVDNSLKEE